jgi:hypothetical protein
MKSRQLIRSRREEYMPTSETPHTGEHCPESGWWSPVERPSLARFIHEGSIMPPNEETSVRWIRSPR